MNLWLLASAGFPSLSFPLAFHKALSRGRVDLQKSQKGFILFLCFFDVILFSSIFQSLRAAAWNLRCRSHPARVNLIPWCGQMGWRHLDATWQPRCLRFDECMEVDPKICWHLLKMVDPFSPFLFLFSRDHVLDLEAMGNLPSAYQSMPPPSTLLALPTTFFDVDVEKAHKTKTNGARSASSTSK